MSAERYLLKTKRAGRVRTRVWDATQPIAIGDDLTWVLEPDQGAVRVRYLGGAASGIENDASLLVTREQAAVGKKIELPDTGLILELRRLRPLPPAYAPLDALKKDAGPRLTLGYEGVGKTLLGYQRIHSAYVAYSRGKPVFTVVSNADGYRFKALLDGVRIKKRGQAGESVREGESVSIVAEQIGEITIVRGAHWWKFNTLSEATVTEAESFSRSHAAGGLTDEGKSERALFSGASIALAALLIFIAVLPKTPSLVVEPPEAPVVRFVVQPKVVLLPKPMTAVPVPVAAPAPVVRAARPAPREMKKVLVEKKPPPAAPARPKVDPHVRAQAASQARLKALREALGGAMMLTQKASPSSQAGGGGGAASGFEGGSVKVGQTRVKAGYSGNAAPVATVGGSAGGVGYASGERAAVKTGGSGFVSVDAGAAQVQEGLTRDEVGKVIHGHLDEVRYCHETALLYKPNLEGRVLVEFSINSGGRVVGARVQSENVGEKTLPGCIVGKLSRWQFPKPKGGVTVKVSYPFNFKTLVRD